VGGLGLLAAAGARGSAWLGSSWYEPARRAGGVRARARLVPEGDHGSGAPAGFPARHMQRPAGLVFVFPGAPPSPSDRDVGAPTDARRAAAAWMGQ